MAVKLKDIDVFVDEKTGRVYLGYLNKRENIRKKREITLEFSDMIKKIARKDIALSLKIWDWCVEQFMPHARFEWWADKTLTCATIDDLYEFPKKFKPAFVRYLGEHPMFCHSLFRNAPELANDTSEFVYIALQRDRKSVV